MIFELLNLRQALEDPPPPEDPVVTMEAKLITFPNKQLFVAEEFQLPHTKPAPRSPTGVGRFHF